MSVSSRHVGGSIGTCREGSRFHHLTCLETHFYHHLNHQMGRLRGHLASGRSFWSQSALLARWMILRQFQSWSGGPTSVAISRILSVEYPFFSYR